MGVSPLYANKKSGGLEALHGEFMKT